MGDKLYQRRPEQYGQQYFLEEENYSPPCRRTYKIQRESIKILFFIDLQWDAVRGLKHEIYGSNQNEDFLRARTLRLAFSFLRSCLLWLSHVLH